ncbi:phospholipase D1/2 [Hasllibacter halocynthiae]|uniref:Phospholipase D n=1 Tax=Hasllibacter halocynthiae TaxID=595589 RepID=A0A2T0X1T7_9RHOB|nr:phospholipase D-like domain-containing protein [Hasllibacter halocynthiae]PRY92900.1 phospholipase D1/2 [Hasllibacter halocynthiae]
MRKLGLPASGGGGAPGAGPPRRPRPPPARAPGAPAFLVTAEEGFPAFERLFLGARRNVRMGFRIFDPRTPLYSAEGLAVGRDWFDLLVHTLARGVDVDLVLADFDPVVASPTHRLTWRSIRILLAAEEVARASAGDVAGRLDVSAALHPARVAAGPRAFLYRRILGELHERARDLAALGERQLDRALSEMPGLAPWLASAKDALAPRRWPIPPLVPATHHQKMAVFDRETLYIGGLDLDERRFDTWSHDRPGPDTWHDVQAVVHGPAAAEADDHLQRFLDECARRAPVMPCRHLLRTLSRKRRVQGLSMSPEPVVSEIADLHAREIGRARGLIYLETQFLRDRAIARALVEAARRDPGLTCILILPAAPEEVAFQDRRKLDMRYGEHLQARCVRRVRRAFGSRLFVGSPARPMAAGQADGRDALFGAPIIYVHAKVSIFGDAAASVSSANLNGRSMRWDTETGVAFRDPADVRHLRERCMRHWLPDDPPAECLDPSTAAAAWTALANRNASLPPAERQGFLLPHPVTPAERFGRPVPGVPEEMV